MIYDNKPDMVCLNDVFSVALADCKGRKEYASGLYTSEGELIQGTAKRRYGKKEDEYIISGKLSTELMRNNRREITEPILYIGNLRCHYGHFIVDDLARLWWCLEKDKYKELKVGYIVDLGVKKIPDYYIRCFEALGVHEDRLVRLEGVTHLNKVLVPEKSYSPGAKIYQCYFDTFKAISNYINNMYESYTSYEKIFLSRSGMNEKNDFGEKTMDQLAKVNGFKVLYPEQMPFIEQVIAYSNAKVFVSPNGTLAHNILWGDEECQQVILNRFSEKNMHQEVFMLGQETKPIQINCYISGSHRGLSCYKITPELKGVFPCFSYDRIQYTIDAMVYRIKRAIHLFRC